jgi:hypothetical protein
MDVVREGGRVYMRQELTAEVASSLERVWEALVGDLAQGGDHVRVVERERPFRLRLDVRHGAGERLLLSYELSTLDDANTAVRATIEPVGPRYLLKRAVTFGSVDRGYLDVLAVGLQNLQVHLEGDGDDDPVTHPSDD